MSDFLVDANVLIDIATINSVWEQWSAAQVRIAAESGALYINPIIYAELAPVFRRAEELDRWINSGKFRSAELPYPAAWRAAEAYAIYRNRGGSRTSTLPDFYIGAHAEVASLTLITRDATRYRTYFPRVTLVTPLR